MHTLRTRRPYTASDDPYSTHPAPEVLDRQEQEHEVQQLVHLASDAVALHHRLIAALEAVLLLVLLFKSTPGQTSLPLRLLTVPFLFASLARPLLTAHLPALASLDLPYFDLLLAVIPTCAALSVLRSPAEVDDKLLWGVGPVGALVLAFAVEHEGKRALREAQGLRGLMYDAPEA
ncbi:hypothetical protein JCM5296_003948 [Sporobolomyces johnsonii]